MSSVKYYVVQPYHHQFGDYFAYDPIEAQSEAGAIARAKTEADEWGGAVAFSRVGDPDTGVFQDAVILARFGETPSENMLRELE